MHASGDTAGSSPYIWWAAVRNRPLSDESGIAPMLSTSGDALRSGGPWRAITPWKLFLLAIVVRACFIVFFHVYPGFPIEYQHDAEGEYLARSIVTHGAFTNPYLPEEALPSSLRSPGHPYLLATILVLSGEQPRTYHMLVYGLYSLISASAIVVGYHVAARVFDKRSAAVGGIMLALYPPSIYYATNATCDATLVAAALVVLVLLAMRFEACASMANALLFGFGSGILSLINPSTLSVSIPLVVRALWRAPGGVRRRGSLGGCIAVTMLLVMSPWLIRNACVFNRFVFLRSNFGMELRAGNSGSGLAFISPEQFHMASPVELRQLRELGEPGYDLLCRKRAKEWILDDPLRFLRLCARRAGVFWGKEVFFGQFPVVSIATVGLPLFLGGMGVWYSLVRQNRAGPLLVPLVFYPLIYYVTHAQARFRFPVDQFLIFFGAFLVTRLISRAPNET